MSEKPQVFLSSTWSDLRTHRQAVIFTLTSLRWLFEAMEYFGALPGNPIQECLASVKRCDIYVGIVGTRYGSVDANGISITQREYEQAVTEKKQMLIFLIDEATHTVLPKDVETGPGAAKLNAFKTLLKSEHTCAFFSSEADLALKVSIGLTRLLPMEADTATKAERIEELTRDVPLLVAESGYGVTLSKHVSNLSDIFSKSPSGEITINDPGLSNLLSAGFIASRLKVGDFRPLNDIMTFDKDFWSLLVLLIGWFGIDTSGLRSAIGSSEDPVLWRVLVKIAGELHASDCTEVICETALIKLNRFENRFSELHLGPVTPLDNVIKESLCSMTVNDLPVVTTYVEKAKKLKRWKQKQIFEVAVRQLSKLEYIKSS